MAQYDCTSIGTTEIRVDRVCAFGDGARLALDATWSNPWRHSIHSVQLHTTRVP